MARPAINQRAFLDRRLRAIDEYLRAHLSEPKRLSLNEAARIANVSPEYLCRLFRQRVGVSFIDWQCSIRTAQAKHLIVEQQLQISAVSRAVGYEHCETFARVFKRIEGVTPTYLRWFVVEYPELASAMCSCMAELVLRIGPVVVRNPAALICLQDAARQLIDSANHHRVVKIRQEKANNRQEVVKKRQPVIRANRYADLQKEADV